MSTQAADGSAWRGGEAARAPLRLEWTAECIALLRRRWAEGVSARVIGSELGVSRSAVLGKIFRLGLPAPAVKQSRPGRKHAHRAAQRRPRPENSRAPAFGATDSELAAAFRALGLAPSRRLLDESSAPAEAGQAFGNPCALLDLTEETCRWPVGEPDSADFVFCGATPFKARPYCLAHCLIAYRAPGSERAPRLSRWRSRVLLCLAVARAA
jgi:GcrA cell cycle regulator